MIGARTGRRSTGPGGSLGFSPGILSLAIALVAAAGCLDDELDPAQATPSAGTFIALERDFQSFLGWTRVEVGQLEISGGHAAGPRFAYVKGIPSGASFPVGTMIVKTTEVGDPSAWTIHARAKRGGGFNPQGAIGWEWFDLRIAASSAVTILWRGAQPPKDHGYESLPGLGVTSAMDGDCNSCHGSAQLGDYILSPPLRAELGL
jgi:hypothetical protein